VLLQELHASVYSASTNRTELFSLADRFRDLDRAARQAAKELGIVIVGSLFERRAAGIYHNTAVVLERDGHARRQVPQDAHPDDPGYYEKFYSRPATLASRRSRPASASSACCVLDQGIPKARA